MRRVPVLIPFLAFVTLLFIGILIFTYVETKKANPQMIQVGVGGWGLGVGTRRGDGGLLASGWAPAAALLVRQRAALTTTAAAPWPPAPGPRPLPA